VTIIAVMNRSSGRPLVSTFSKSDRVGMNHALSELFPPSSITDAVFIPNFLDDVDALVTAQGNRLVVNAFEGGMSTEEKRYEIYGEISRLIPIRDSILLVLLTDLRACILSYDQDFVTISSANLMPANDCQIPPPKFAHHPMVIVLQLASYQLQVFPIDSHSIGAPFPITIGCREIIDFVFIGPLSKVTRLAVLIREFTQSTVLRIIEIDSSEGSYSETSAPNVPLPADAYSIIAFDPDNQSIVVVFSSQQAIRVLYNVALTPKVTTATISTPDPLIKMIPLEPNFYIAVDQGLRLRVVKLEGQGTVHFVDVDTAPHPTALVAISPRLAFVASATDDSVFFAIDARSQHQISSVCSTIKQTGPVRSFVCEDDNLLTICDRAVIETALAIPFNVHLKIEATEWIRFWTVVLDSGTAFLLTNGETSFVIRQNDDGEFVEVSEAPFVAVTQTIHCSPISGGRTVQVLDDKILVHDGDGLCELELDGIAYAANWGNALAVVHQRKTISLFDIADDIVLKARFTQNRFISGIAVSETAIAVSFIAPFSVVVYSHKGDQIREFAMNAALVALAYDGSSRLIAAKATDSLLIVSDIVTEIPCQGAHCGLIRLSQDSLLIAGSSPAILRGDCLTPLKCCPTLSAAVSDDQVYVLSSDGLYIGDFGSPEYFSDALTSDYPFLAIHSIAGWYFTARLCPAQSEIRLYKSKEKFCLTERDPFHVISAGELFQGFVCDGNNLLVCTRSRDGDQGCERRSEITRFLFTGGTVARVGEKVFRFAITGFGRFRDFLYLVFDNQVDFFTLDTVSQRGCHLTKLFSLEDFPRILHFSFTSQIAVTVGPSRTLSAYAFDAFGQRFISLPSHQATQEITGVTVLDDGVIYATEQGNICRVEIVSPAGAAGSSEFQLTESFSIGDRVTCLESGPRGSVLIGTEKGMIAKLRPLATTRRFAELYAIIAQKVTSLGRFQKSIERLARTGKYYTTRRDVCDTGVVQAFKKLRNDQKRAVLVDTDFTFEEADALLKDFELA
jgi:hypothetical protein